jgi:hypothetical protein
VSCWRNYKASRPQCATGRHLVYNQPPAGRGLSPLSYAEQHGSAQSEPQPSPHAQPSQSQPGHEQFVQFSPSQLHSGHAQSGPQQQAAPALTSEPAKDGREVAAAIRITATTASNSAGQPKRCKTLDMEILLF